MIIQGEKMLNTEFDTYVLKTYNREPVFFTKGKKAYLFDKQKNKWLDFLSGLGVTNLGHCHPQLVRILSKQARKLWHTSNLFLIRNQYLVAKNISQIAFEGKTFFCNSGAEANEAALKLARKWGKGLHPEKTQIIALKNSFHGRTMGSLTLTGQEIYQKNFTPLLPDVDYVEPNQIDEIEKKISDKTAAVFLETIQGEGGVYPLNPDFVVKVRELTQKHQALLIIDEVQTGIGRTGKYFGYQHYPIIPDVITMAKGLGNGIPIGAMHVRNEYAVFVPGDHASTFGGNYLSTAVALKVLEIIQNRKFQKKLEQISRYLENELRDLALKHDKIIQAVRGKGMMWGIVTEHAQTIYQELLKERVIVSNIKNKVVRILPPLIIGKKEVDLFIRRLKMVLKKIEG